MVGYQTNQHSCSPPNISSFPTEIITHIALFCDKATALSLARVARRFTALAEAKIWQHLDLFQPHTYGDEPAPCPVSIRVGSDEYRAWLSDEAERAEARHGAGLKEKMKTILFRADERRAGSVQTVTIVPRTEALIGQCQVLEAVSASLQRLEIQSPVDRYNDAIYTPTIYDTLDFHAIRSSLSFPALTHIRIHEQAIHSLGFVTLLCVCSPNLLSLDINHRYGHIIHRSTPSGFPDLTRNTKIEHLRISTDDDDFGLLDVEESKRMLDIIARSPNVKRLSTELIKHSSSSNKQLGGIVSGLSSLECLHLFGTPVSVRNACGDMAVSVCARRLVLWSSDHIWWELYLNMPIAPNLELLLLDCEGEYELYRPAAVIFPEPAFSHAMVPCFAEGLRRCPKLHIIHTESGIIGDGSLELFERVNQIEKRGNFTGSIRSFRCGESEELLHARMLEEYRQISDTILLLGAQAPHPHDPLRYSYIACDGSTRVRTFEQVSRPIWNDYTDFEGLRVPLEIIAAMRQAEDVDEDEWVGRGIEVGEKAWKVLTDWRDEAVAGKARGKSG